MDWSEWHRQYESYPSLQARLRIVQEQIAAALDAAGPGVCRIVSLCAGDGRDLMGAVQNHSRRGDVRAALLDNDLNSIQRGQAAARAAGLEGQLRLIHADATVAGNYAESVPADVVLLSGFLGHLRHRDIPGLIRSLSMFCRPGGFVIWNRHLVLYDGREQVRVIRELLRQCEFEEVHFETTAPDGFAVGRARFRGRSEPLDASRVLFEFVGLDRLTRESTAAAYEPTQSALPDRSASDGTDASEESQEAEDSIPERFEKLAAEEPSRPAIGSGAWQPSYGELNAAANRVAQSLISSGGGKGDRVAVLMRHDAPLIAAILAVLKAGRVVVILNPLDPAARSKEILKDADPQIILTDAAHRKLAGEIGAASCVVMDFDSGSRHPAQDPEIPVAPGDLAFLLYTSGSTGRAKGVMQTHRNMLHNVMRHTRSMRLRHADRILLMGSPGGGQGMATVWCALLNGAALCPFPAAESGVTGLAAWIQKNQITIYISSVSVFRHFVRTLKDDERFPTVRVARFASEPAGASDFAAWQKHFSAECVLLNTLSSTETGNLTRRLFGKNERVGDGRLPAGKAVEGIQLRLLNEQGRDVADGEVGEIAVRSRFLSPGYWRDERLTAARFFDEKDGGRVYRSGDLGRRTGDGDLIFMGRKDDQVKIRGYRIEISEVEDALAALPGVDGAVVRALPSKEDELQLAAWVVPRAAAVCTAETLRRGLRQSLPGYMIPAHFVFLERFPLSPTGKVDRQSLPAPDESQNKIRRRERPRDIVEASLVRIWESALGIAPIARQADFFDLGGNSLQSAQVLASIEESWGTSLPPSTLIEHSTIEKLAVLLTGSVVIPSASPLVLLRGANAGRPLFLVHSGQGDVATYGLLARRLPGRPVYGLQSVGLQGEAWPLTTVSDMARRYLQEITAVDPSGPYFLGATCMGGLVAFEMARRLIREGKRVALLAFMDVRYPIKSWQHHEWRERWYGPVRDPVRDAFRMLRWRLLRAAGLGRSDRWLQSYRRFVAHMNSRADRAYAPEFYAGELTLFITEGTPFPYGDPRLMMRAHAQESRVITVSGIRRGLFLRPTVDELAQKLQQAIEKAEAQIRP